MSFFGVCEEFRNYLSESSLVIHVYQSTCNLIGNELHRSTCSRTDHRHASCTCLEYCQWMPFPPRGQNEESCIRQERGNSVVRDIFHDGDLFLKQQAVGQLANCFELWPIISYQKQTSIRNLGCNK